MTDNSLQHIDVGSLVRTHQLHEGRNEEFDCFVLDEEKLCSHLEDPIGDGGKIVDFHTCDVFPDDWFDLVVVLRAENGVVYDRLEKRFFFLVCVPFVL